MAYPNDKTNNVFVIISFDNTIVIITGISISDQHQNFSCIRRGACSWVFKDFIPETNVTGETVMLRIKLDE